MNVAATITLTPGTVISRLTSGQDSASAAISASTAANLCVEEVDLAQRCVGRLALLERQLELLQPPAALDAEQVGDGRLALQPPDEHRVDLVLRARAGTHELRSAGEPAPHRPHALVGHPDRIERACCQELCQGAGVEAVGLRARLANAGVTWRDDDHARDVRLQDARDLPGVAGHFERDLVTHVEALGEQLERFRPCLDAAG